MDKPDIKLVRALQADFKELYQPGSTVYWQAQRLVRNMELGIMRLENLEKHIQRLVNEVIGEDEGDIPTGGLHRDWLRAEQRQRADELIGTKEDK